MLYFYSNKKENFTLLEQLKFFENINKVEELLELEYFSKIEIYKLKVKNKSNLKDFINFFVKVREIVVNPSFNVNEDESVLKIINILKEIENILAFKFGLIGLAYNFDSINDIKFFKNMINDMKKTISLKYKKFFYTKFLIKSVKLIYSKAFNDIEKFKKVKDVFQINSTFRTPEINKIIIKSEVKSLHICPVVFDFILSNKKVNNKYIISNKKRELKEKFNKNIELFLSEYYYKIDYVLRTTIFQNKINVLNITKIELLFNKLFENINYDEEFLSKYYHNDLKTAYKQYENIINKKDIESYNDKKIMKFFERSFRRGNVETKKRITKTLKALKYINELNLIIKKNEKKKQSLNIKKTLFPNKIKLNLKEVKRVNCSFLSEYIFKEYILKQIYIIFLSMITSIIDKKEIEISQIIKLKNFLEQLSYLKEINFKQSKNIEKIAIKEINDIQENSLKKIILLPYLEKQISERLDFIKNKIF